MMKLGDANKIIAEVIPQTIRNQKFDTSEGGQSIYQARDFDNLSFAIFKETNNESISFSVSHYDFKNIFAINGEAMLKKYYPELDIITPPKEGYDLTLNFKLNAENIKKIEDIANRIAEFRVRFFASPFEKILQALADGKKCENISFQVRQNERIYLLQEKDNITVYYGLSFIEKTEYSIGKLILQELEEATRQITNPVVFIKVKEDVYPDQLMKAFPAHKNEIQQYASGLQAITIFQQHLKNIPATANMLGSFRSYLHYHITASKTYLHSVIRKNVGTLQKQITDAKIDEEQIFKQTTDNDEPIKYTLKKI